MRGRRCGRGRCSLPACRRRVRAAARRRGGRAPVRFGAVDDLGRQRRDRRGLRGHLGALRARRVTTGAVKIVGIGATGLARRGARPRTARRRRGRACWPAASSRRPRTWSTCSTCGPAGRSRPACSWRARRARRRAGSARWSAAAAGRCARRAARRPRRAVDARRRRRQRARAPRSAWPPSSGACRTARLGRPAGRRSPALTLASEKVSFTQVIAGDARAARARRAGPSPGVRREPAPDGSSLPTRPRRRGGCCIAGVITLLAGWSASAGGWCSPRPSATPASAPPTPRPTSCRTSCSRWSPAARSPARRAAARCPLARGDREAVAARRRPCSPGRCSSWCRSRCSLARCRGR